MSYSNNHQTLEHYMGQVWLTRPGHISGEQSINVCVELGGDFVALDNLTLQPDGVYRSGQKKIGKKEDDTFKKYIEKLAGTQGMSEADLFDKVCDAYEKCQSFGSVARELDLSKERVRRILITRGKLTSKRIAEIAFLHDGGKGSSISEIAKMLNVSEDVVLKNLGYTNR